MVATRRFCPLPALVELPASADRRELESSAVRRAELDLAERPANVDDLSCRRRVEDLLDLGPIQIVRRSSAGLQFSLEEWLAVRMPVSRGKMLSA